LNLEGKSILVIGGAGFIGSHVVEELLKEDVEKVIVYNDFCKGIYENLNEVLKDDRCSIFEAGGDILQTDILDAAMKEVDCVVHLAALWLLQCHEYPETAFEANIRGTFNVLDACVKNNIERLVFSSSASVYGDMIADFQDDDRMAENHTYNNHTFYGATKIAGEHMFKAYHGRYGLNGAVLRYMNVYGPRQEYKGKYTAVMMKVLDSIYKGESPIVYGEGDQEYDFIHVTDAAQANVCALKSTTPFGFYNVGTGIGTTIKQLVESTIRITGSTLPIKFKKGTTFVTKRVGNPLLAESDLGFKYSIELEEGLNDLVKWYMQVRETNE
jgi:UDP-glucose 4-epimerase